MYIRDSEVEICISDLLASMLKAIKLILCITLIFVLLGSIYGASKAFYDAKNPTVTQEDVDEADKTVKEKERELSDAEKAMTKLYEVELPDAEKKVERAKLLVQRRQEYINNSLYYSMNPFHRGISRVTLYVDTDTPINNAYPWLSVDPQASIAMAYTKIYPFDSEIIDNIRRIMGTDAETQYINELVKVSNISNQFVEICVYFDDADVARQVTDYLLEAIQTRLEQSVGKFSANVVGYFVGYEVDWTMSDSHNSNDDNLLSAERAVTSAEETLETLQTRTKEDREQAVENAKTEVSNAKENLEKIQKQLDNSSANLKNFVKKMAKYAVVCLFVGVFLGCGFVFVRNIMDGRIQSSNTVISRYAFPVIGVLPSQKKRWFEKTIRKLEGEPETDYDTAGKVTAQSLVSIIGDSKTALVSSEGGAVIDALLPYLDGHIPVCGDILKDAGAVRTAEEYDGFVLVEEREKSSLDQINNEVRRIESMGKKITGIVLL